MKKYIWGGYSSHDEGPALTARFTGGQVIREMGTVARVLLNIVDLSLV